MWAALIAWSALLSPPADGGDTARMLAWLQLDGDPLPAALFNYLGLWPLVYGAVLLRDPRQRVPAWPFVLLSLATGAFGLMPYLMLRRWSAQGGEPMGVVRSPITRVVLAAVLTVGCVGLLAWGLGFGSWTAWAELCGTSPLCFIMSSDFVVLTAVWYLLMFDDAKRRPARAWALAIGCLPVLGAPLWLLLRAPQR